VTPTKNNKRDQCRCFNKVYMDDILVGSRNIEEHFEILAEVFKMLVENKLELRMDKFKFLQDKVKYLVFLISCDGTKADDRG